MKNINLLLLLGWMLTGFACQKDVPEYGNPHLVEIWTIEDYSTAGAPCEVNTARLVPKDKLIANEEILTYHAADHYFTLTAAAINRLKTIKGKTPFYLKVDNQVVYSGLLMPSYLSLACSGIIIDPLSYSNNTIQVRFSYLLGGQPVTDLRNNALLLKALEDQGKLKK